MSNGKALENIKDLQGAWVLISYDEDASLSFNGLPRSARDKDDQDDAANKIIIPESAIEKQHDVKEWERVYKVEGIGKAAFEIYKADMTNKGVPEECIENNIKEGDYVIAKGNVMKLFTKPQLWAVGYGNIVATVNFDG
jgi:hypothetical protein